MSNIIDITSRQPEARDQVLERLFVEHGEALRCFVRMRLGQAQEQMDDVVQEVFIRLARIENLADRLPVGGASNRSYIFAAANNLIVDMERRKARQRRFMEKQQMEMQDEEEINGLNPESITLANDEFARLMKVLLHLKPVWRNAFILTRIKLLSYREAADQMGVSVRQVERYLISALTRIRKAEIGMIEGDDK